MFRWKMALCASAVVMASTAIVVIEPSAVTASTPPQFGTLSNFDVFNDTGTVTHGFEIEIDGVSSTDILYKFGAPYERYGDPVVSSFAGGVNVIYSSPYDSVTHQFTAGTPVPPTPIAPTAGHACWTGGAANYPNAGCEHFGFALSVTPSNVVYSWLVTDPAHAGHLIPFGGGVSMPAPAVAVTPPPPASPNPKPIVQNVVAAAEPDLGQQLGTAIWVKVYVTQSTRAADLNRLVSGDAESPRLSTEVETEWALLQQGVGGGLPSDLTERGQIGSHNVSVTRRFEFYKYTGPYDPSSHEATPVNDSKPSPGELGNFMGASMAALNVPVAGKLPGDHTAPKVTWLSWPAKTTRSTSARFSFKATDPDNRTFAFYCALDKAIPKPCTTPKTFSGLRVGAHRVEVYASDVARNASRALIYTWTITK